MYGYQSQYLLPSFLLPSWKENLIGGFGVKFLEGSSLWNFFNFSLEGIGSGFTGFNSDFSSGVSGIYYEGREVGQCGIYLGRAISSTCGYNAKAFVLSTLPPFPLGSVYVRRIEFYDDGNKIVNLQFGQKSGSKSSFLSAFFDTYPVLMRKCDKMNPKKKEILEKLLFDYRKEEKNESRKPKCL